MNLFMMELKEYPTMAKRALITGIAGQDGSYLAEFLLQKGYEVFGLDRSDKKIEDRANLRNIKGKINLAKGDLLNQESLIKALQLVKPNEVYNLAAQSLIQDTKNPPSYTFQINVVGVQNLLEAIKIVDTARKIKFFQASSSAMYGDVEKSPQDEKTLFNPKTPYAISKLAAHLLTHFYRENHGMFCGIGILFNHESPRRSPEAIMRKVTKTAVEIKLGIKDKLKMGTLDTYRDQGFAGDYVKAMWMILQQEKPEDYVIATGEKHKIRELVELSFSHLGLDYNKYYEADERFMRKPEHGVLVGDSSKARKNLLWKPEIGFKELVKMMIDQEMKNIKK